jgi:hypothetical protein
MLTSPFSAYHQVGLRPVPSAAGTRAVTEHMATDDGPTDWRAVIDPHNPLSWLVGFLLVTVGAASVAGSVRLGRARIRASVGSDTE